MEASRIKVVVAPDDRRTDARRWRPGGKDRSIDEVVKEKENERTKIKKKREMNREQKQKI